MLKRPCRFFLTVCVLILCGAPLIGKGDEQSAEALVSRARTVQALWTEGTPPMTLKAEITVYGDQGKSVPGQYIVHWVSRTQWREDVRFSNYHRVRLHDAKGYWQESGLAYEPEIIFQLDKMLDYANLVKIGPQHALGKVKERKKDGALLLCADVKWASRTEQKLCFDETAGNLVSIDYPRLENENRSEISRIEYSGFTTVGEKRVPFDIRALHEGKVVLEVKVLEIAHDGNDQPGLFLPSANSEFWPQCDDLQEAQLAERVTPQYPPEARANGEMGRVIFYAVIEADGRVSNLTLIQHATPSLEDAAAKAIRQWRYKPATCNSTPIRVETSISTDFWLQR